MNKQITEDYVSYEIAKLLKEKGFDVPLYWYYDKDGILHNITYYCRSHIEANFNHQNIKDEEMTSAPTHQMALKWLMEVHNICITIDGYPTIDGNFEFKPRIFNSTGKYWEDWHLSYKAWFTSHEQAVEVACLYVLKNLI